MELNKRWPKERLGPNPVKPKYYLRTGMNFWFRCGRIVKADGVCSEIGPDCHILMWDYDGLDIEIIKDELYNVQLQYLLPDIYIVKTENGYHAYCFKRCTWTQCRTILASCTNIDYKYLGIGCGRGYFTLRYANGEEFDPICTLPGYNKADTSYKEVQCFVEYSKEQ